MKSKKIIAYGFIAILLILAACEEEKKKVSTKEYLGPMMAIDNLNITYSDSGYVRVKVSSAKQLSMENQDIVYPKAVFVNFIDKLGVEYSSLRSDSANYSKAQNLYTFKGNVFFFNRQAQQSMETNELFWNPSSKKIYSNKAVKIKTPTHQFNGIGMEANEDFSKYTIKQLKGTFMVDSLFTSIQNTEPQTQMDTTTVDNQ